MSTFNTNTGSVNDQLMLLYTNLGGVMNPDENSASYSVQGWLAKINEVAGSIPNGQIINGTAFFVQDTEYPSRDGGVLVEGDLWYNPSTGKTGYWQSPYWLNIVPYVISNHLAFTIANGAGTSNHALSFRGDYWADTLDYQIWFSSADPTTNFAVYDHSVSSSQSSLPVFFTQTIDTRTATLQSGTTYGIKTKIQAGVRLVPSDFGKNNVRSSTGSVSSSGGTVPFVYQSIIATFREIL